jgi:hypothetical protein
MWFVISETGVVESLMASRDFAASRAAADTLYELLESFPEKTCTALGLCSCARAAAVNRDWEKSASRIDQALTIVKKADIPVASWQVYATASKIYAAMEQKEKAAEWRERAIKSVDSLAQSLHTDDPLRSRFAERAKAVCS